MLYKKITKQTQKVMKGKQDLKYFKNTSELKCFPVPVLNIWQWPASLFLLILIQTEFDFYQ